MCARNRPQPSSCVAMHIIALAGLLLVAGCAREEDDVPEPTSGVRFAKVHAMLEARCTVRCHRNDADPPSTRRASRGRRRAAPAGTSSASSTQMPPTTLWSSSLLSNIPSISPSCPATRSAACSGSRRRPASRSAATRCRPTASETTAVLRPPKPISCVTGSPRAPGANGAHQQHGMVSRPPRRTCTGRARRARNHAIDPARASRTW